MYILQCTKPGMCDFDLIDSLSMCGEPFCEGEFIANDGERTKSLNRAMVFETKKAASTFVIDQISYMDDGEPEAEFKPVAVTLSLK